jgi:hypothetical protein
MCFCYHFACAFWDEAQALISSFVQPKFLGGFGALKGAEDVGEAHFGCGCDEEEEVEMFGY